MIDLVFSSSLRSIISKYHKKIVYYVYFLKKNGPGTEGRKYLIK